MASMGCQPCAAVVADLRAAPIAAAVKRKLGGEFTLLCCKVVCIMRSAQDMQKCKLGNLTLSQPMKEDI